ncbi:MAG: hypothetical protein R3F60_26030 [bacterium]
MSVLSGPWSMTRAKSFFYLAVAFWKRQIRRAVGLGRRDEGGVARFLENYAPEGMAPLTLQRELGLQQLGGCIQCGLCEAVGNQPADRVAAYSRAIAMSADAAAVLGAAPTTPAICPAGVPLQVARPAPEPPTP